MTEFSIRLSKRNFKGLYVPKSKIWHKVSASSGGILNTTSEYYLTRNRFLFMKKNATKMQFFTFLLYYFVFKFWFRIAILILYHQNLNALNSFLDGTKDGLKFLYES